MERYPIIIVALGAHMTLFPAVLDLLAQQDVHDLPIFGGGIVPPEDIAALEQLGVHEIFTPGASTDDIVAWARTQPRPRD